jgi:hypothetical protein
MLGGERLGKRGWSGQADEGKTNNLAHHLYYLSKPKKPTV